MKTQLLNTAALGLLTIALGCGLHQDPLQGHDTRFKDGRPVPTTPIHEKPVASNSILISAPEFQDIEEGKALEFEITVRLLIPDLVLTELKVENLSEFPGATFDSTTGKFKWTPPLGFVNKAGGADRLKRKVSVLATALKSDGSVLFNTFDAQIQISREYLKPTIVRIQKEYNVVREGSTLTISVRVKDLDAIEGDRSTWPQIQFARSGNRRSLATWIEPWYQSLIGSNEYELRFRIDLTSAELTRSSEEFVTTLTAISRFKEFSDPESFNLTVYTSLVQPLSTWGQTQVFKAGEKRSYQFLIYDPKQEARLAFQNWRLVPQGAVVSCTPSSDSASVLNCNMEWEPTAAQAGSQSSMTANIQVRNTDVSDTHMPTYNLYLSYRVAPANFVPAQAEE